MIYGPGGSKSRLAKAAGAEPCGQMRDEKLHAVVARSTCPSQKCTKQTNVGNAFGSCDVEKVHAVAARSAYQSQNVQNTPASGPLLEVVMSKKCTPSRRKAHFQVKMPKKIQLRSTFRSCDVEKVHAVVARSTFPSQNVQNITTLLAPLTPPWGKKCNIHYYIFIPP